MAPAPPAEPAEVEALSGPDDADVAVDVDADVDADVDTGMHSQHTTSRTTSITTYGRLDLGKSPPQAFVLAARQRPGAVVPPGRQALRGA
ncbi:hypothetical protein G6F61_014795 [Rhizopus arrhizus]|nr:hypothetical protein G6F61_014795 [Rhizopus arrhizus]